MKAALIAESQDKSIPMISAKARMNDSQNMIKKAVHDRRSDR